MVIPLLCAGEEVGTEVLLAAGEGASVEEGLALPPPVPVGAPPAHPAARVATRSRTAYLAAMPRLSAPTRARGGMVTLRTGDDRDGSVSGRGSAACGWPFTPTSRTWTRPRFGWKNREAFSSTRPDAIHLRRR